MTDTAVRETPQVKQFRAFWQREMAAAWLYRELADLADDDAASTLRAMAATEDEHASHWIEVLEQAGASQPEFRRVPLRERLVAFAARRVGVDQIVPYLIRLESKDAGMYVGVAEAPDGIVDEEIEMGRALGELGAKDPAQIVRREARHRSSSGGALRAATFGVNDGLVSNLALVMGVAGGATDSAIVLLAGVAGLVAGAMSMAAGEWVSVRSQRELYEREIEIEGEELKYFPEQEAAELRVIFEAKGLSEGQARQLTDQVMKDPDVALDTLVREELGLDPGELGSPWVAALSSFFAFAVGAFVPVLPFLFVTGTTAVVVGAIAASIMLALVGATLSIFTGRSPILSGGRMVLIGMGAAAITYGVGSLVGVAIT